MQRRKATVALMQRRANTTPLLLQIPSLPEGVVMLKMVAPDTVIPMVNLEFTSLGEQVSVGVSYFAREQEEFDEKVRDMVESKITITDLVTWLVKEWEMEYPLTEEGLQKLESQRPGTLPIITGGWRKAMQSALAKN